MTRAYPRGNGAGLPLVTLRVTLSSSLVLGAVACGGVENPANTARLDGTFAEVFRDESFFSIGDLDFAPGGHLVVLDGMERAVTVLDAEGGVFARWHTTPDESAPRPDFVAVSRDSHVAVYTQGGGVDVFTLSGERIDSHATPDVGAVDLAFDGHGTLLAESFASSIRSLASDGPHQVVRLPGKAVLWSSPPLPGALAGFQLYRATPVFAHVGSGTVAVGMSDVYDLTVLDTSTGETVGRIVRNVPIRAPDEAHIERFKARVRARGRIRESTINSLSVAETFPAVSHVFRGPPDGTVWVRRHLGVSDSLAPTVEAMKDSTFRMYDLFAPDTYEYMGTAEAPNRVTFMAGDDERLAGVLRDPFGVRSVAVFRWSPGG